MATVAKCLSEVQAVRDVACGAEVAYVARSRVARLGLSVARLVSELGDCRPPERPGKLPVPNELDGVMPELIGLGNTVQDIAEFIRQPSEPLDGRWTAMWGELERHLDSLEGILKGIGSERVGVEGALVR